MGKKLRGGPGRSGPEICASVLAISRCATIMEFGLVWRIYYGLAIILWIGHYRRSRVMDWSIETLVGVTGCF